MDKAKLKTLFDSGLNHVSGGIWPSLKSLIQVLINRWVLVPLAVYFVMMFIVPWFYGNWDYVQSVWARWQTFNAAMIAFGASLIAVHAAHVNEEAKRKRELIAARALLPSAASTFVEFTESLVKFHNDVVVYWELEESKRQELKAPVVLPDWVSSRFRDCMVVSKSSDVIEMAEVLSMAQYLHARTKTSLDKTIVRSAVWRQNNASELYELGEMMARLSRFFDYGRELDKELDCSPITKEEVINAFYNLDIREFTHQDAFEYLNRKFG